MSWRLRFTKAAQKDAVKLSAADLRPKAEALLDVLRQDPFRRPPPFVELVGDLRGAYSRRVNLQCRLVYEVIVDERVVKVLRMWTHDE